MVTRSPRSTDHLALMRAVSEARKGRGPTRQALADRPGSPQSCVAKIAIGERRLDALEFAEIVLALDTDATALLAPVLHAAKI